MAEKVVRIEMNDGTVYENPTIWSPRDWRDTDRVFMRIVIPVDKAEKKCFYIRMREIAKVVTDQGEGGFFTVSRDGKVIDLDSFRRTRS